MNVILSKPEKYSIFESTIEPASETTDNFVTSFEEYKNNNKHDELYKPANEYDRRRHYSDLDGFRILFGDYDKFGLDLNPILIEGQLYDRKINFLYHWNEVVEKAKEIKENNHIASALIYVPELMAYYYIDPTSFAPILTSEPQFSPHKWVMFFHVKVNK